MSVIRKNFKVGELWLDPDNPRFPTAVESERAAMEQMILLHKDHVLNLAADIVEFGPNPSELPILFRSESDEYWIVAEGNRRVTAIKLLNNPGSAEGIAPTDFIKKITELSKKLAENIKEVFCVVENDEHRRAHWLSVRHRGQQGGVGVVTWGTPEQTRFDSRHGKQGQTHFAYKVREALLSISGLKESEMESLQKVSLTSLQRMLNTKEVRDAIGIDKKRGEPIVAVDDVQGVQRSLLNLVGDLATQKLKIEHIKSQEQRAGVAQGWAKSRKPGETGTPVEPVPLVTITSSGVRAASKAAPPKPKGTTTPAHVRPNLIPTTCAFRITSHARARKLYIEMRQLKVEGKELIAAVTLRVFLELSITCFIDSKQIPCDPRAKFKDKMEKVGKYLEDNAIMPFDALKTWRRAYTTHDLFSVHSLHSYIHDLAPIPRKKEILMTWDEMQPYLEVIWKNI